MRSNYLIRLLAVAVLLVSSFSIKAQLIVDQSMSPDEMAQNLVGEGVEIFNVQVTAADSSYGYYYSAGTEIGDSEGILLTTGNAANAIGPNDESGLPIIDGDGNCVNCDEYDNYFAGSPLLTTANGGLTTWDACTFEFDVAPQGDSLRFDFVFASEEYLEWVGSSFNDVFGFFISGPGVGTDVNIALIPGTGTPVTINTVNHIDNTEYFYDNQDPLGQEVQYDGITQGLTAEVGDLTPCETYHLKLIVADGSDRLYDSGVFISRIESNPVTILTSTAGGVDYMVEGCNDGVVTFESSFVPINPLDVIFSIEGDAEIDVDYTTNPDLSPFYNPLDSTYTLTIDPGDTTVSFDILTIDDGLIEGTEVVTITLLEQLCDTLLFNSQIDFSIVDSLFVDVHPETAEICPGNCVPITGDAETGGTATFTWTPDDGLDNPSSLTPVACPTETTTYILTSNLSSCVDQDSIEITVTDLELEFTTTPVTCEDGFFGEIDLEVLNGAAPYDFEWTGPNGFTASTEDIVGLEAGEYCVTVTDAAGCTTTDCVTLEEQDVLDVIGVEFSDYVCHEISCNGFCDGSIDVTVAGGTGDYTYDWTGPDSFTSSDEDITGLCAGTYNLTVTDENGCMLEDQWTLSEPDPLEVQLDGVVDVLCNGEETGSACVTSTGGCAPYFYSWSHEVNLVAPCAFDLGSDTYTVAVSDVNGCSSNDSVIIFVGEPGDPISITVDAVSLYPGGFNVSCPGASDGSIDITVDGGIPGYLIVWQHLETGDTYFTEDLSNLPCGTYVCTVTDSNDCTETVTVDLTCVPEIEIEFTTEQNPCGDPIAGQGEIDITNTTGGHGGPYIHTWLSGPSCPCAGLSLTGLDSGDYELEVTDSQGCTETFIINIGENQDFTVTETIADASCFNLCDGSIEIDIVPDLGTELYTWTGPDGFTSSAQDISNLCPGNYQLEIVQGDCNQIFNYTVGSPPDITLDIIDANPPLCFGQNNGSIDIAVGGGTGVLDVQWLANLGCNFPGASGTSINSLEECDYVVTVTDEDGCVLTDTIPLIAPQVMILDVETTEFDGGFNVSCAGAQDGQISVTVLEGGTPDCVLYPDCYSFDWSNCDDVSLYGNDPNSPIITDLPGGVYCVNVEDVNGCLATTTITFLEPDSIDSSPSISDYNGFNISCNGANDAWIAPNISGGSGDYEIYEWTQGDIGANDPLADTLFNLAPDTYCLYVFDSNGCADTSCFEIIEPDTISIELISVSDVTCFGYSDGTITVDATGGSGGYTYDWVDDGGTPYVGNILINLPAGVYTLTVTDSNGCTTTLEVELIEPPFFGVTLSTPVQGEDNIFTLQCNGDDNGSIIALIEGGFPQFNYLWEDCDSNFLGNDLSLSGLEAGCYCLTVTDSLGCEVQECLDITEPEFPLDANATVSLYPGDYNISCPGAQDGWIDLNTSGGVPDYTYVWQVTGDTTIISVDEDLLDLGPGLYDVLVTDANGCDTTVFLELFEPAPIIANSMISLFDGGYNVSCNGEADGEISVTPSGGEPGYSILWAAPLNVATNTVSNLEAGTYSVSITDTIGCELVETYTLTEPDSLLLNETLTSILCNGDPTGEICVSPTGGSGTYEYLWPPSNDTTLCVSDLGPGNYCVTVTDSNGCIADDCWDLTEPEELSASDTTTAANCGECDGTIDLTAGGGTPGYTFDWSGGVTEPGDEDQADLCAGAYTCTITDSNGCELDYDVTVDGPLPIEVSADIDNPACYGDCDGIISLTITNAVTPYTVTWSQEGNDVATGEVLADICSGAFDINITDADGCEIDVQYGVVEPDSITVNGITSLWDNGYNVSSFDGNDGTIDTEVEGGTPEYTYEWEGPLEIEDGETGGVDLIAGAYQLTITDANGCIKDTLFILTQPFDITLPTGLSPNNDGANDFFVILGVEEHPDNTFIVFNRWGNLVYEKDGYQNDWYGQNMDGEDLPDGTYYVIFEADNRQFQTYVDLRR